jgi:hypothetical protein
MLHGGHVSNIIPFRIITLVALFAALFTPAVAQAQGLAVATDDKATPAAPATAAPTDAAPSDNCNGNSSCMEELKKAKDSAEQNWKLFQACSDQPNCSGVRDKLPPAGKPKALAPSKPAPKPLCLPGTVYQPATNTCVCDDQLPADTWLGDDGGMSVKVEQRLMVRNRNGRTEFACVATEEGVRSLWRALDKRIKENCDVTPTISDVGPPDNQRYSNQECGELRAYLDKFAKWKNGFDHASTPDGKPAPLNVENWIDVWMRVNRLGPRVDDIEKDLAENVCRYDRTKGEYVHCPSGVGTWSTPALLAVVEPHFRPGGGPTSLQLRLDAVWSIYSAGDSRDGFYLHGGAGLSFNPQKTRYAVAAGAGWVHDLSSSKSRSVALRLGLEYRAEPTLGPNDVHAIGGGLSFDLIPVRPLFLTFGVLGGGNVVEFYKDGQRTNFRSSVMPFIAANAGIGVTF